MRNTRRGLIGTVLSPSTSLDTVWILFGYCLDCVWSEVPFMLWLAVLLTSADQC